VEADAALGRIVEALPPDADLVVFSGLGMTAETSRQDILGSMLAAVLDGRQDADGSGRAWDFRGRIPKSLRARVADLLPDRVATSIAAALELRGVDWSSTRAFVLPSDTIGYIRFNVRGRERQGIVDGDDMDGLAEEIRAGLGEFTFPDGSPATAAVERRADVWPDGPCATQLPDLVVRWAQKPARPREVFTSRSFGTVQRRGAGSGRSGNHNADAWALLRPGAGRVASVAHPASVVDLAATALGRFGLDHEGRQLLERA
jgi:predicted AlkP superfamily phosphohydrolase/phosphomutase